MLEKEYKFYQDNKASLIKNYLHKHIVIKDDKILGSYNSMEEAISEALIENELGTFLVKYIEPEEQTVRFYNRVFA